MISERALVFLRPYIEAFAALVAGTVADFLLTKVHVLGDFHDRTRIVSDVSQIIIWSVTATIVWTASRVPVRHNKEETRMETTPSTPTTPETDQPTQPLDPSELPDPEQPAAPGEPEETPAHPTEEPGAPTDE